jgi:hypothetical protein
MGHTKTNKLLFYQIENQTQCTHIARLSHTSLHQKVPPVQHPFQLYQQSSPLYSCTCDRLRRIVSGNKKRYFITIC